MKSITRNRASSYISYRRISKIVYVKFFTQLFFSSQYHFFFFRRQCCGPGRSRDQRHGGLVGRQLAVPEEKGEPSDRLQQLSPSSCARADVGAEPVRSDQAPDRRSRCRRDVGIVRLLEFGFGRASGTL